MKLGGVFIERPYAFGIFILYAAKYANFLGKNRNFLVMVDQNNILFSNFVWQLAWQWYTQQIKIIMRHIDNFYDRSARCCIIVFQKDITFANLEPHIGFLSVLVS